MTASPSILAVPGLASTSPEFRSELYQMAARNGWDADAIAAVISIESGFKPGAKNPNATASGLIQFIDSTARSLGVGGGAAKVRTMSAVQQLPLVERYYRRAFGARKPRPVDYYLAGWGSGIGQPDAFELARADAPKSYAAGKHNLYTLNAGLDADGDGVINVGDIRRKLEQQQSKAAGKRLDAMAPASGLATLAAAAPALLAVAIVAATLNVRGKLK